MANRIGGTGRTFGRVAVAAGRRGARTRVFPMLCYGTLLAVALAGSGVRAKGQSTPDLRKAAPPAADRLDPNPHDDALMRAARAGDLRAVEGLLRAGAAVDQRNGNGGTALMYAAVGNHPRVVDLLLRHGADVDARGANGWGALMIACAKGYVSVVRRLLAAGADVNAPDIYGWTPLMRAVYERRPAVAQILLASDRVDLDAVTDHGSTALHLAAVVGARDIARKLLDHGADASMLDSDGRSAADIAEARGDRSLARLLRAKPLSFDGRSLSWVNSSS